MLGWGRKKGLIFRCFGVSVFRVFASSRVAGVVCCFVAAWLLRLLVTSLVLLSVSVVWLAPASLPRPRSRYAPWPSCVSVSLCVCVSSWFLCALVLCLLTLAVASQSRVARCVVALLARLLGCLTDLRIATLSVLAWLRSCTTASFCLRSWLLFLFYLRSWLLLLGFRRRQRWPPKLLWRS